MSELALSDLDPLTVVETDPEMIPDHGTLRGRAVLDVGCGTGDMVLWLASQGARPLGFDTKVMVDKARTAHPEIAGLFLEATAERLPVADDCAAVVLFLASFHHVPEPQMLTALSEAARVLEPGGSVILVEPVAAEGAYSTLTRIVDDEAQVRKAAVNVIARHEEAGLVLESEAFFAMRRTLADFRSLLQVFVEDVHRRRDLISRAEAVTQELASSAGITREEYTYLSVCRRTILSKARPERTDVGDPSLATDR